jgi:cyclin-dependent kinase 9
MNMGSNRGSEIIPSTIMNTKEKEKYIEEFDFPFCDEASKYEKVAKIGQGTFG